MVEFANYPCRWEWQCLIKNSCVNSRKPNDCTGEESLAPMEARASFIRTRETFPIKWHLQIYLSSQSKLELWAAPSVKFTDFPSRRLRKPWLAVLLVTIAADFPWCFLGFWWQLHCHDTIHTQHISGTLPPRNRSGMCYFKVNGSYMLSDQLSLSFSLFCCLP